MEEQTTALEEIIMHAERYLGLCVDSKSHKAYMGFLDWQTDLHPEYDLDYTDSNTANKQVKSRHPFRGLLVDKLMLFSYMIGMTPIIFDSNGSTVRIGRKSNGRLKEQGERHKDLVLLSPAQIGAYTKYSHNRTDPILLNLFYRHMKRKGLRYYEGIEFQNWQDLIDEIGSYSAVDKYYGHKINFAEHVRGHRFRNVG